MGLTSDFKGPSPIVDSKEATALDNLTKRYDKLIEPSMIAKLGTKAGQLVPEKVKQIGSDIGLSITEKELYVQMMNIIGSGFKAVEEQAVRFSVSEKYILDKINKTFPHYQLETLSEICLVRSYDLAKIVNGYRGRDTFATMLEGGGTGAFGFWGLPFNIVLSTFLYFRAVQSIAMFYGYDVKNDYAEMVIASDVFTSSLSPAQNDVNNEATSIIGKIMVMSQAAVVKQTAKKTWTDMAARGGVPLLLTQMRALANKSAQKALQNVGAKGLENSLFKEAFEQIGRKLTLKTIGKAVPVVSGVLGALIDTAQMKKVLEFSDIFYHKRFILEKEDRVYHLFENNNFVIDTEIVSDEHEIAKAGEPVNGQDERRFQRRR